MKPMGGTFLKPIEDISPIFIVGMRRAGTSFLRKLIMDSSDVQDILFEPHILYHSVIVTQLQRLANTPHVTGPIEDFCRLVRRNKGRTGAKFAINPGVKGMEWICLNNVFPKAQFVFIGRNVWDNHASYWNEDKDYQRGVVPFEPYEWFWIHNNAQWNEFCTVNPDRGIFVSYDRMVESPVETLAPVWDLLKVSPPSDKSFVKVRKPRYWMTNDAMK